MKDFTTERAQDEVEFYMGIVVEEEESFEGLIEHLHDAFKSGKTHSKLISDFCGESQKTRENEDTFTDDLQVLARKIIVCKPPFHLEVNNQLKAQYVHKLQDLLLCSHGPQCIKIFLGRRNIYKIPGMPSDHVLRAHKIEQILCYLQRHQCQGKSNWTYRE